MCSILFYQNLVKSLANLSQKVNSTTDPIFNQYNSVISGRMIYFIENSYVNCENCQEIYQERQVPGRNVTLVLCSWCVLLVCAFYLSQRWHRTDIALQNKVNSCLVICWIILIVHVTIFSVLSWSKLNEPGEKRNCFQVNKLHACI